jgi:hypothetical protein
VETPAPPPIASPGRYGGRTSQGHVLTFDVLTDGRAVTNLRVAEVRALCEPPALAFLEPAFTARYPLAADGTFSIVESGFTVRGNLLVSPARGSLVYEATGADAQGVQRTCKISAAWTATLPPPPLPSVTPGTYCGFTGQGGSICFDVTTDARVANVRVQYFVDCLTEGFDLTIEYAGTGGIRETRAFSVGSTPFPFEGGSAAGGFFVAGTFDATGGASGNTSLLSPKIQFEGKSYTCRHVQTAWSAKLQG